MNKTYLKKLFPWWVKIGAKIIMARIPLGYRIWRKAGIFVHGAMADPAYAYGVFERHYRAATPKAGFVGLELGPGDSLASAIIAPAFGGSRMHLVDSDDFVSRDVRTYEAAAEYVQSRGMGGRRIADIHTVDEVLKACSATYLTAGLNSLRSIPGNSVDFIFSQAVLEHIKKDEFRDVMGELRRILRDDGVSSHAVDLRDHLDNALNNLRFSEKTWEADLFAQSGFYTNRIRYGEMLALFRDAGFAVEVTNVIRWDAIPTPKSRMAKIFATLTDDDLRVASFSVVLRPRKG